MATYLEIAQTLARRMGGVVREYSSRRGVSLIVGKQIGGRTKDYVTFPQTPNPAEDVWVPGGYVQWGLTKNVDIHKTALRPIFAASGRPGATWGDLEAETDFAQLKERAKGLNEALGVDLLSTDRGVSGGYKMPESLHFRPILVVKLRPILLEGSLWEYGGVEWVRNRINENGVWVEDGPDVLERLRALLDGFLDGTYPEADASALLQPDWTAQKEAALAIEKFVRSSAPRREPEREYLNYFGFDDTTD